MDSSSTLLQKFQLDTLYKIRLELQLEPPQAGEMTNHPLIIILIPIVLNS